MKYHFSPHDMLSAFHPAGMMIDTLVKGELEFVAWLIVRYHHWHGLWHWSSVSMVALIQLMRTDPISNRCAHNPFWRPDVWKFIEHGYIEGWGADQKAPGTLTQKFFDDMQRAYIKHGGRWLR